MKVILQVVFCFVFLGAVSFACAKDKPDEVQLERDLRRGLEWNCEGLNMNQFFELSNVTKTNSLSPSKNTHVIEFEGNVIAVKTFYFAGNYKCIYEALPSFASINPFIRNQFKQIYSGRVLNFRGKAYYELTEKGWRIAKFDAPIKFGDEKIIEFQAKN